MTKCCREAFASLDAHVPHNADNPTTAHTKKRHQPTKADMSEIHALHICERHKKPLKGYYECRMGEAVHPRASFENKGH
jgi:hypothetical protein